MKHFLTRLSCGLSRPRMVLVAVLLLAASHLSAEDIYQAKALKLAEVQALMKAKPAKSNVVRLKGITEQMTLSAGFREMHILLLPASGSTGGFWSIKSQDPRSSNIIAARLPVIVSQGGGKLGDGTHYQAFIIPAESPASKVVLTLNGPGSSRTLWETVTVKIKRVAK